MQMLYLIGMCDEDDREKIKKIYYEYSKLMMYIAMEILHDNFLAEDAVQNAFISIMNYSQKINDVACPQTKSLIVIITRSASIDIYRKRKLINMQVESIDEDIIDDNLTEDQVIHNLEIENLVDVIGSLPNIYSDVLLLTYVHDLSTKEIAQLCGTTIETAKKRLQRSRQALKKELKRREIHEESRATAFA